MKPLARKNDPAEEPDEEAQGLERALDKSYSRIRERAREAWERHHAGKDPSEACVSVRVSAPADAPSGSTCPRKRPPRLLVRKTPRRKVPRPHNERGVRPSFLTASQEQFSF